MKTLGVRHWLAVLLAAAAIHAAVLMQWHVDAEPPAGAGGSGAGTLGITIALAEPGRTAPDKQSTTEAETKPETEHEPETQPEPEPELEPEPEPQQPQEPKPALQTDTALPPTPVPEPAPKQKPEPKPKPQPKPDPKPNPKPKPEPKPTPQPATEPTPEPEPEPVREPVTADNTAQATDEALSQSTQGGATGQPQAASAAGVPAGTGTVADTPPSYRSKLGAWLAKHKKYPRRARRLRMEGTAVLFFVMDRNGQVLQWEIHHSSGHKLLDEAVVKMIKRANPMPALPPDVKMQRLRLTVPINFELQ